MTYPDPLHTFFVLSWHSECSRAKNRLTVADWADRSGGLIPARLDDVVAEVASPTDHDRSVAVTNWLLHEAGAGDQLAHRVLGQSLRRAVLKHVKIETGRAARAAGVTRSAVADDVHGAAISAIAVAVSHVAHRPSGPRGARWPRWRLETQHRRELLRLLRAEARQSDVDVDVDDVVSRLPSPVHQTTEVALGRFLRSAVDNGVVSGRDAQLVWLSAAGYSATELGDAWAMQPATIRKTMSRARRRLEAVA